MSSLHGVIKGLLKGCRIRHYCKILFTLNLCFVYVNFRTNEKVAEQIIRSRSMSPAELRHIPLENSVDKDQLASDEAVRSGSTLFPL